MIKKSIFYKTIVILASIFVCSCSVIENIFDKTNNNNITTKTTIEDIDTKNFRAVLAPDGNYIAVPKKIRAIAAMSPAVTDMILALGFYNELILVDYYSYQVGRSIATNENIIKTDMLNPNIEAIVESGCDIVFISDINYIKDRFDMLEQLGIIVINVPTNNRLHQIGESIEFVGRVLDREELAKNIALELNTELRIIKSISSNITNKQRLYFEMESPPNIYTFGSGVFINDIVELIGAENVFKNESAWIKVSEESVIESNPDVIIAFDRHGSAQTDGIKTRSGWQHIKAIQNNRVYFMNNDGILSRPTHNIVYPIREIAKYVYPNIYNNLEQHPFYNRDKNIQESNVIEKQE